MLNLSLTRRFWKFFPTIWLWKMSMWPLNYQHILASVVRYVRSKWMALNKCCEKFFCALVRPSTLEHHRQQGKCSCFLPIWICRIQWLCSLFRFRPQIPFLGKFGPKNQNCQVILKFGTWTNSNMPNSVALFNFSPFYWNYPFWSNLFQPWCHAVLVFFVTLLQSHVYMYLYINRIYISLCFNSCI